MAKKGPIAATVIILAMMILAFFSYNRRESVSNKGIKIGVSDDISGFVVDYMVANGEIGISDRLEPYFIKDCCANTSQWALSSGVFEMAIVCKEAAKEFTRNLPEFEVVSDAMRNTDVFVMKTPSPKKIGVAQGRDYQRELVRTRFGEEVEIVSVISESLPFLLEKGELDGIVMDYTKSVHLEGIKESTAGKSDYTSYVFLAKKSYIDSEEFKEFIDWYNLALSRLEQEPGEMERQFYKYTKANIEEGGLEKWKIKLLQLKKD